MNIEQPTSSKSNQLFLGKFVTNILNRVLFSRTLSDNIKCPKYGYQVSKRQFNESWNYFPRKIGGAGCANHI